MGRSEVVVHPGFLLFVAGLPLALAAVMAGLVRLAAADTPHAAG